MDCKSTQTLIAGYLDHELDPVRSLEIEGHLRLCSSCSLGYKADQVLRDRLRNPSVYFKASDDLRKRLQRSLRQAANAGTLSRSISWSWLKIAAPVAAAAIVILTLVPFLYGPRSEDTLAQEVLSSHIRSLMPQHLTDVASSDHHTVKPWFNGRLDFSPAVVDLAKEGFPLVGGRIDYVNNRPVAALVYGRRKHLINVFVWPSASGGASGTNTITHQGYNLVHWSEAGMSYWVVSDLNKTELLDFARRVRSA
jgi:anti-sigma factor RsiW